MLGGRHRRLAHRAFVLARRSHLVGGTFHRFQFFELRPRPDS